MRINVAPVGGTLAPLYSSDKKKIDELKEKAYVARISTPRNVRHHNKAMALLRLFVRTTSDERFSPKSQSSADEESAMNAALDALKYEIGLVVQTVGFDGEIRERPKSISFEEMGQDEFQTEFYNPAVRVLARELGCTEEDIETNSMWHL